MFMCGICLHVGACTCVCKSLYGNHLSVHVSRQSLIEPGAQWLTRLDGQWIPGILSLSLSPQYWDYRNSTLHPEFSYVCSGLHAYLTSSSMSHLPRLSLWWWSYYYTASYTISLLPCQYIVRTAARGIPFTYKPHHTTPPLKLSSTENSKPSFQLSWCQYIPSSLPMIQPGTVVKPDVCWMNK